MVSETIVMGLLNASIMGVALALAILAVVIPAFSQFQKLLKELNSSLESHKARSLKTIDTSLAQSLGQTEDSVNKFYNNMSKELKSIFISSKDWLLQVTFLSFILYCLSAILMVIWCVVDSNIKPIIEIPFIISFIIATICILVLGSFISFIYFEIYKEVDF